MTSSGGDCTQNSINLVLKSLNLILEALKSGVHCQLETIFTFLVIFQRNPLLDHDLLGCRDNALSNVVHPGEKCFKAFQRNSFFARFMIFVCRSFQTFSNHLKQQQSVFLWFGLIVTRLEGKTLNLENKLHFLNVDY